MLLLAPCAAPAASLVEKAHEDPTPKVAVEQPSEDATERSTSLAGLTKRCFVHMARALDSLFVPRETPAIEVGEMTSAAADFSEFDLLDEMPDFAPVPATIWPDWRAIGRESAHFLEVVRLTI